MRDHPMTPWIPTGYSLPARNQPIEWLSPLGLIVLGTWRRGRTWAVDSGLCPNYVPAFWRASSDQ